MKRVAFCLHGQPRALGKAIEYHSKNLLNRKDICVDVFIHTWNYNDLFPGINERILSLYNPRAIRIDSPISKSITSKYTDPNPPRFNAYSNYCHYSSIGRCEQLKKQYEIDNCFEYDWVIKTRFDFALNVNLDFEALDSSKLYICDFDLDFYYNTGHKIKSDAFVVGNSQNAAKYASVIDHVDELYKQTGSIDGHGMFGAVLKNNGLVDSLRCLDMNHPFPPSSSDCLSNSFIRDDFASFHSTTVS